MAKTYLDSEGVWSSPGAGSVTRAGSDLSDQATTVDNSSSTGTVLQVPAATSNTDVAVVEYDELPFGLYSIIVRAKSTVNSGSNQLIEFVASAGDAELIKYVVKESDFHAANAWESLGFGVDYKGTTGDKLKIALHRGTYSGTSVLSVDYVQVAPAPVAINAIA